MRVGSRRRKKSARPSSSTPTWTGASPARVASPRPESCSAADCLPWIEGVSGGVSDGHCAGVEHVVQSALNKIQVLQTGEVVRALNDGVDDVRVGHAPGFAELYGFTQST